MKHLVRIVGIGAVALVLAGCVTTGLSTRETREQNYSTYLYALYDNDQADAVATRPTVALPVKAAVAQIGEVAPPQAMLDALRKEAGLFRTVEGIPGIFELDRTDRWTGNRSNETAAQARQRAQAQVKQMLRFARDLGMDYLFLYGGSMDYGTRQTGFSVLDLTIVGGYLLPSQELKGTARVSGALVEVSSGRVVLVVSAESQRQAYAPTLNVEGAQDRLLDTLREETITKLTQQLIERMSMS